MKLLITNDDGPPGEASPYVLPLYRTIIDKTDWEVIVVLPDSQKSWISKAIFISDKVVETYYDYKTDTVLKTKQDKNNWYLLSGTPATCSAIGIHHLSDRKPDLVISGPNLGRNTSSIAALASGTIGAALEATSAGVKSIAVSYAYWNKESREEWVEAAGQLTVRLAQHLYDHWDPDVDLYSINIPLCQELMDGTFKILKTHVQQSQHSCLFQPTSDTPLTERQVRDAEARGEDTTWHKSQAGQQRTYEFRPTFSDLAQSIDDEHGRQSDTWAISQKNVSVTPLKANFQHVAFNAKDREIKL